MSNPMTRGLAHVATALATVALVLFVTLGGALADGNNGTIKIHQSTSPAGTPNNEPKVCTFNVEGFGFDVGQQGYIRFEVQGGDAPQGVDPGVNEHVTAVDGSFSSNYHTLRPGHYKATLYDDVTGEEKAKSKVFKVTCCSPEGG